MTEDFAHILLATLFGGCLRTLLVTMFWISDRRCRPVGVGTARGVGLASHVFGNLVDCAKPRELSYLKLNYRNAYFCQETVHAQDNLWNPFQNLEVFALSI